MSSRVALQASVGRAPGLASGQVRSLVAFAQHRGIALRECLAGTGLSTRDYCQKDFDIALAQELQIIRNLMTALPAESPYKLGYAAGLRSDLNIYGLIGQSVLSSPNIGDALGLISRYTSRAMHCVQIRSRYEDGLSRIEFQLKLSVDPALEQFLIAREMGLCNAVYRLVTGDAVEHVRAVGLQFTPAQAQDFLPSAYAGCPIRWEQKQNYFLIDPAALDLPMLFGDASVAQLLEQHCYERMQQTVALPEADAATRLVRRVQELLTRQPELERDAAARLLNMSTRSLSRRLQQAGTCWRTLLSQHRAERAKALLQGTDYSLERVAELAGYASGSALTHAFQQHFACTPARWRSEMRACDEVGATPTLPPAQGAVGQ